MICSGVRQHDNEIRTEDFYMTSRQASGLSKIKWDGNFFKIEGYASWEYWDKPNSNPESWSYFTGYEGTSILGEISTSGDRIDSCSDIFNHNEYNTKPHIKESIHRGHIFICQSLPVVRRDSNQLVFSQTGIKLQGLIRQFIDSSFTDLSSSSYKDHHQLKTILWNQSPRPILTITFFK